MKIKLLGFVNQWISKLGEKDVKAIWKTEKIEKMKDDDQW